MLVVLFLFLIGWSVYGLIIDNLPAIDFCDGSNNGKLIRDRRAVVTEYVVIGEYQAQMKDDNSSNEKSFYLLGVVDRSTKEITHFIGVDMRAHKNFLQLEGVVYEEDPFASESTSTLRIEGVLDKTTTLSDLNTEYLLKQFGLSDSEIEGKRIKYEIRNPKLGDNIKREISPFVYILAVSVILLIPSILLAIHTSRHLRAIS